MSLELAPGVSDLGLGGLGGALPLAQVGEYLVLSGAVKDHKAVWRKDGSIVLVYLTHQQVAGSWGRGEGTGLRAHFHTCVT